MTGSLAAFRNSRSVDLRRLAEEHLQHDLSQEDRDTLRRAGSKVSTYAKAGSLFGVGFGIYCAFRLRSMRMAYFNAFRATEKPVRVQFADGRTEPIPDISDKLAPSKWGDAATCFFFATGGLFLGGEVGLITGTASASRTITKNSQVRERVEKAFKDYRIDALRQEIKRLESESNFKYLFET
jgi:hypothetical protein